MRSSSRFPVNSILMVCSVCIAAASCASAPAAITPQSGSMSIDGSIDDWHDVSVLYFEDNIRAVGLSHDEDTLYLMWYFADERLARTIAHRGVTVWFNSDDTEKKELGIRYAGSRDMVDALDEPRRSPPDDRRQQPPDSLDETGGDTPGRRPDGPPDVLPGVALQRQEAGTITILSGDEVSTLPESAAGGIRAASTFADGVYRYELAVPFSEIGELTGRLAIGFQVGGLSEAENEVIKENMKGMRGGMGGGFKGGFSGGMGGRPSSGGPGGGGSGGGPRPRDAMESETSWIHIQLPGPAS